MKRQLNRRGFFRAVAGGSILAFPGLLSARSPNETVRLACVGVGGKGWSDLRGAVAAGAELVAYCDVDTNKGRKGHGFPAVAKDFPRAKGYVDWREMLDKEHKRLDAVTISTPDHMHAPITMTAIQLGLATYTQKPLTRTIYEARQVTLAARRCGVVTQMGNQHHNGATYKTLVQVVRSGIVGKIKEAHAWSNRPIWPQGIERPAGEDPVPPGFHWDLWLGVAPKRPFKKGVYHPFKWRGWYDFGAGALGDMGCHIIDPVVWALELGPAKEVWYEGPKPMPETFPKWERIHYVFAGTRYTAGETFKLVWHDGGKQPSAELAQLPPGRKLPSNGTLFIGEKGTIVTPHGGGAMPALYPAKQFADYELPRVEGENHYAQWIRAIRGEGHTTSNFDYAGPLTETVLLGTVAARVPGLRLQWDADNLRFPNSPEATELVRQPYRKGWEVSGL